MSYKTIMKNASVLARVLLMITPFNVLCVVFLPVISQLADIVSDSMIQNLSISSDNGVFNTVAFTSLCSYIRVIIVNKIMFDMSHKICTDLKVRMSLSHVNCGAPFTGKDLRDMIDFDENVNKLSDYLFLIPFSWVTIVQYSITLWSIEGFGFFLKFFLVLLIVLLCFVMTKITDVSLYNVVQDDGREITKISDFNFVRMRLSIGDVIDADFQKNRNSKIDRQQSIQKHIILGLDLIVTILCCLTNNVPFVYTFTRMSGTIGLFSDNVKSVQYVDFVENYLNFCESCEKNSFKFNQKNRKLNSFETVELSEVSFGYFVNSIQNDDVNIKIKNLNFTFFRGKVYYLESENGIGKSTLLKTFTSNILTGNFFIDGVNREDFGKNEWSKFVFYIPQASEYSPNFSAKKLEQFKGINPELEEELCLSDLFGRGTVEMSGGQKKRMLLYVALTCGSKVLLLDETLGELSAEDTSDVPEGGGWRRRVLKVLTDQRFIWNKMILLVGHGMRKDVECYDSVENIKMSNMQSNAHSIGSTILEKCG